MVYVNRYEEKYGDKKPFPGANSKKSKIRYDTGGGNGGRDAIIMVVVFCVLAVVLYYLYRRFYKKEKNEEIFKLPGKPKEARQVAMVEKPSIIEEVFNPKPKTFSEKI